MTALSQFHPAIREWFGRHIGAPTDIQAMSWPAIARGEHVLITAPTGSGKTLTAFLWALNRFARGDWSPGRTRVLYISPLKALNNDIRCNLLEPLARLRADHGLAHVLVQTRSGDTPQSERQRMLRKPPDILITTPESLSLLLTSTRGRHALAHVETVILDEIHAVVGNRRGVQLMAAIERLAGIAGEFQRIALSATVRPLAAVGAYVGGYRDDGRPRPLSLIESRYSKAIELTVHFPPEARDAAEHGTPIWDALADRFCAITERNRSTLFFTNSRKLAEKITLSINRDQLAPLAYAHHGSLARDVRSEVERRMKAGELKAIVATNSLELGIDVGHLDEVVLVQSPPSVASALQRIGRAGHRIGEISRGSLYPTHAQDFLEAAVLAGAVAARDIEPIRPLYNALDVLAQLIIAFSAGEPWPLDQLFGLLRRSAPYHDLPREHFDLVVEMLAGRYEGSRVRELQPRIALDRVQGTLQANRGALLALYGAGGTIPDRGYYQLRHSDSGTLLGELDEEYVWEASIGQRFTLGTQNWQIQRITHNDVLVRPAKPGGTAPPFWRSESFNRSAHYSLAITEFLEHADAALASAQGEALLTAELRARRGFDRSAASELVDLLSRQRAATRSDLPHRHHLLLERVHAGPAGYRGPDNPRQLVIHTFWGGQLNRPWALALEGALAGLAERRPEIHADNNAIVLQDHGELAPAAVLGLVTPDNLRALLRDSLEHSGFFGARFRECAARSLLLTRQRFKQRLPLWMSRLQAKQILTRTRRYPDFPVLLETWRTCLEDEFDLDALSARLQELADGTLRWSLAETGFPSPFAAVASHEQINRYMYADDTPTDGGRSALSGELIASVLRDEALRPRLAPPIVAEFLAKRQRTLGGYEPAGAAEWCEWVKERVLLPEPEWTAALRELIAVTPALRIVELAERRWLAHEEMVHGLYRQGLVPGEAMPAPAVAEQRDAEQLALEVLSFYGPLRADAIADLLPSVPEALLERSDALVRGRLVEGSEDEYWCDATNFETLLRFQRASRRSHLEPLPGRALPGFLAHWQRLGQPPGAAEALAAELEQLRGFSAPVKTWLGELLPPRGDTADPVLDQTLLELGMIWLGTGPECITLCYPEEARLFAPGGGAASGLAAHFRDPQARYSFTQIAGQAGTAAESFNALWWQAAWRGEITADTLAPLRQGLARGFRLGTVGGSRPGSRRLAQARALGWLGSWQLIDGAAATDALSALEDARERVRLLLDRYGVLTRELVNREWQWREAFRALRIMELGGEVVAGYFFEELSGPQFATPRALNALRARGRPPRHFWLCAQDPASPCALGLDWPELPQRRAGHYLGFCEGALALVAEHHGRRLRYLVAADHPELDRVNAPLLHIAHRQRSLRVETINELPLRDSPYLAALERQLLLTRDHKQWYLMPR